MKILFLNTYSNGSTGTVVNNISNACKARGDFVYKIYGRCKNNDSDWLFFGEPKIINLINNVMAYLTGLTCHFHIINTLRIIRIIKKINPDVINIHNIHGNYVNIKMLFSFLKKTKAKVVITMHDQFWITGRCALITDNCSKWMSGCGGCIHRNKYPHCFFDLSKKLIKEKSKIISKLSKVVFVSPSLWQKDLFLQSNLKDFDCVVINNTINYKDLFISKNNLPLIKEDKINLFFAANPWSKEKGLEIINELYLLLDNSKYNFIVAGVNEKNEKMFLKGINTLPLIDRQHLLSYMKHSDYFISPSVLDNFPTVLLESVFVGTPAIAFDVGGTKEIIDDSVGIIVKEKSALSIFEAITKNSTVFNPSSFTKKALCFKSELFIKKYFDIFDN